MCIRDRPSGEVNNKHTVCFMMTDGDNIQWALNDLTTNERWYGYPDRGQFAMGWGCLLYTSRCV